MIDNDVLKSRMNKIVLFKKSPLWVEIITELNYSNRIAWRLKKVLLPKSYREEYQLLGLWKGNVSYGCIIIKGIVKTLINRGKNLLLRLT